MPLRMIRRCRRLVPALLRRGQTSSALRCRARGPALAPKTRDLTSDLHKFEYSTALNTVSVRGADALANPQGDTCSSFVKPLPCLLMKDSHLRKALIRRLASRHSDNPEALIVEELGLRHGAARIDIAVVNGFLHGYELKSDSDSLTRLARQERVYSSVLDRVTLVIGHRHAEAAMHMVPEWWGVQLAKMGPRGGMRFTSLRRARINPSPESVAIARLLWRDEALGLLNSLGAAGGFHSKPRSAIYTRLTEVAQLDVIKEEVRRRLRSRIDWRSGEL
jgi:hypothetical protein